MVSLTMSWVFLYQLKIKKYLKHMPIVQADLDNCALKLYFHVILSFVKLTIKTNLYDLPLDNWTHKHSPT